MAYLIFDTQQEAEQRARDDWEAVLGRPKNPEDVTEFLWPVIPATDASGQAAVVIPDTMTPETMGISEENIGIVKGDPYQVSTVDPDTGEITLSTVDPQPLVTSSDALVQALPANFNPIPIEIGPGDVEIG